jgi:hypothetical protein
MPLLDELHCLTRIIRRQVRTSSFIRQLSSNVLKVQCDRKLLVKQQAAGDWTKSDWTKSNHVVFGLVSEAPVVLFELLAMFES